MTNTSHTKSATHPTRRFVRHYAEMVAAMILGMVVLGAPAGWLFNALGTSWSDLSPAMMLFAMAVTMTVPMVAWMRYRGHAWRPSGEMATSMLLPTMAVMACCGPAPSRESARCWSSST
jgi:hypothetical protein